METYRKIIKDSQADLSFEIKIIKTGGGQGSTYIKDSFFKKLKSNQIIIKTDIEDYPNGDVRKHDEVYVLNDYEFILGEGILELIGDEFKSGNEFLLSYPQVKDKKPQLMKSVFEKLSRNNSKYKWFVDLYDSNISDNTLIIDVDENKREFKLDIEFPNVTDLISLKPIPPSRIGCPHNRIVFGAPGTGKSHRLEKDRQKYFGARFERITFHPNYSYSQFVGTYKPVPKTDENGNELDEITYKFVPGPFLRTYINAMKTKKPYLLLIEELNRANAPAVFGDVFQLLDRKNGESEYEIETSEDMKRFLKEAFKDYDITSETIKLPDNMFIWATMNSADQGVFPLDTAFKRRWDFEYIGINELVDSDFKKIKVKLSKNTNAISWNDLRTAINNKLLDCNVNEDKLLGPFFISKEILNKRDNRNFNSENEFIRTFKYKVLMYLFEDAGKHCKKLFKGCDEKNRKKFSSILLEFDEKGEKIFGEDILDWAD